MEMITPLKAYPTALRGFFVPHPCRESVNITAARRISGPLLLDGLSAPGTYLTRRNAMNKKPDYDNEGELSTKLNSILAISDLLGYVTSDGEVDGLYKNTLYHSLLEIQNMTMECKRLISGERS